MKQFHYIIKDKEKRTKKGDINFESEEKLREHFHRLGYIILSLFETPEGIRTDETDLTSKSPSLAKILIPAIFVGLIILVIIKRQTETPEISSIIPTIEKIAPKLEKTIPQKPKITLPEKTPVTPNNIIATSSNSKIATIKLKGKKIKKNNSSSESYQKALAFYKRNLCDAAIKHAQNALYKAEGNEKKLRSIIRDCRQRKWN